MSFEQMWSDLAPVGRVSSSGGYNRSPFGSAERECHAWFLQECASRGLEVESDGNGNTVGWWRTMVSTDRARTSPCSTTGGCGGGGAGILTGSHLDSVLDGGAYDGPLGVVSALAAIDRLRERGFMPSRPIGVGTFVEEEGSRFGLACLGSQLMTGAVTPERAKELRDRDGVPLLDAMSAAGLEPELGRSRLLDGVGCFLELHVEQGRDLVDRNAAVGVASGIWPHGRYRFDFTGEANHAGTTRMEDRHDPMLTFAMTVLAANKQGRLGGQRATFGRVQVEPNQTNAVPSKVSAWLDARCVDDATLVELVKEIERQGSQRADRDGTSLTVTRESVSATVAFDPDLAQRLAADHAGPDWPMIATQAGHDAGFLRAAGIPTAMLFVRNPTGVSHSPAESAEIADCLVGVEALADSLERLAG